MGREESSEVVRRKVLATARKLILEKGYEGMTIRALSKAAAVSSGSIFHFFGSKDGVAAQMVRNTFEWSAQTADEAAQPFQDPYVALAIELATQVRIISGSRMMAELYQACYRSWTITDFILKSAVARNRKLLQVKLTDWDDDRFFVACLAIKGLLAVLTEETLNVGRLSVDQRISMLLRNVLPVFEIPAADLERTLAVALESSVYDANAAEVKELIPLVE